MNTKGYTYGWHHFPHDVNVRSLDEDAKSRRETLMSLGVRNLKVVERTKDIRDDIEAIRKIFPRLFIDEKNCGAVVDALNNFKKEWDDKLGEYKNYPKHDRASHYVSTLRLLARAWKQNSVDAKGSGAEKSEDFF
jgi:predicted neutral ceramidase superfamily lipid hydrolase